ncbi:MAG TPA: hypothetical protein VM223_11465 [Planctomycetota bacterium]|nr:hypothetical protein [Planctomycetota bacterium]
MKDRKTHTGRRSKTALQPTTPTNLQVFQQFSDAYIEKRNCARSRPPVADARMERANAAITESLLALDEMIPGELLDDEFAEVRDEVQAPEDVKLELDGLFSVFAERDCAKWIQPLPPEVVVQCFHHRGGEDFLKLFAERVLKDPEFYELMAACPKKEAADGLYEKCEDAAQRWMQTITQLHQKGGSTAVRVYREAMQEKIRADTVAILGEVEALGAAYDVQWEKETGEIPPRPTSSADLKEQAIPWWQHKAAMTDEHVSYEDLPGDKPFGWIRNREAFIRGRLALLKRQRDGMIGQVEREAHSYYNLPESILDTYMAPREMAAAFGVGYDALRMRLLDFRNGPGSHDYSAWKDTGTRKPREPKYLYKVGAVKHIIQDMLKQAEQRRNS